MEPPTPHADLDKIKERIQELTAKITAQSPEHYVGSQIPIPRSLMNDVKELRTLRRQRDNNEN